MNNNRKRGDLTSGSCIPLPQGLPSESYFSVFISSDKNYYKFTEKTLAKWCRKAEELKQTPFINIYVKGVAYDYTLVCTIKFSKKEHESAEKQRTVRNNKKNKKTRPRKII